MSERLRSWPLLFLLGAFVCFGEANAEPLSLRLGGEIDFQARDVEQSDLYSPFFANQDTLTSDKLKFSNDTRLFVNVEGRADQGFGYGAFIELLADVTQPSRQEGVNANRTFAYMESGAGRVELGNTYSVARVMKVNSASFARATGGIDGDYSEMLNLKLSDGISGFTSPVFFISAPRLPTDMFYGSSEKATKISYYSPKWNGFQAGASYTPDTGLRGTAAGFTASQAPGFPAFDVDGQSQDVISPAVSWERAFGKLGLKTSVVGEFAPSRGANETTRGKLAAYAAGLNLSYEDFIFGGSYGYWGNSLSLPPIDDSYYWDVGAGYQLGAAGFSAGYLYSDIGDGRYTSEVLSFGADYQLAPGLLPYVEVTFFDFEAPQLVPATIGNNGHAIFAGVKLVF